MTVLSSIAAIGAVSSWLVEALQRFRKSESNEETIEDRIQELTESLNDATSLIQSIEAEVKARSELANQLQKDVDQYTKLVEVKKPEVEAIAQLLRGELRKEGRSSFWKGFIINFLFFILGAGVSWLIK